MKYLYKKLAAFFAGTSQQSRLVEFIGDERNINKAVEGSMQKRIELMDRVSTHHRKV